MASGADAKGSRAHRAAGASLLLLALAGGAAWALLGEDEEDADAADDEPADDAPEKSVDDESADDESGDESAED